MSRMHDGRMALAKAARVSTREGKQPATEVAVVVLPDEPVLDEEGFAVGSRPLCPFCSKPWSAKMMDLFTDCSEQTGYYGDVEGIDLTIDITCDGCDRLIYQKEVEAHDAVRRRRGW